MRLLALTTVLVVAAPVTAQTEDYRSVIDAAVAEFGARRFAEARALFRRAHALQPSARTHRGIGLASFEMSDYATARRELSLAVALEESRRPLSAAQRAEATELILRTHAFLGHYRLDCSPESARVWVDGSAAVLEPDGSVWLALGTHTVEARAPGHEAREQRLEVRGGEDTTLAFQLVETPRATVTASPPPSASRRAADPPAPPPSASFDPTAAVASLVVGGALAAGALATGLGWWLGRDEAVARCDGAGPECRNAGELRDARDAAAGTTVALALLGLGAGVVGLVLLSSSGSEARPEVACAASIGGLTCRGRF